MPRTSPVFYVLPSAISIIPNANNSANDLAVFVSRGTKIKVYSQGITQLSFTDNTYQEWTLAGRNRRLADNTKPYTIYARLAKEDKSDGYLVFAPKVYEDDVWKDKYPYVTWVGLAKNTATPTEEITNATGKYWWIKLGEVALPESGERTLDYDTGILGTDQFNSEWNLDPDDMPLRIEIDCSVEGENAGPTPYVPWGKELILRARLVEGWADTDIERFRHWTIQRNTGDESADMSWPPEGRAAGFGKTGNIVLSHSRIGEDDFNGAVSSTFTVVAWGTEHEDESSSDIEGSSSSSSLYEDSSSEGTAIVPIAKATIAIMAETVEKYELELSTAIVSYDPTTDAYSPTDGIKVRVRATDQKGSVFKLTRSQFDTANLIVQYAMSGTDVWTDLAFGNAASDIAEAIIPINVFAAQQNINVRICKIIDSSSSDGDSSDYAMLDEIYRTPIAFVRNGEDSREREWIYLRSEQAIVFIEDTEGGQGGHLVPRLIPAGEVNPPAAAAGIDTNKNQDGWVPEGWWDEMQGTDDTYHYEYGSYRDWIREGSSSSSSGDAGSSDQRIGHWGEFSKPTIWSYRAEDAVTYRCRWTLAGNDVYQLVAAYTGAFRGTLPLVATLLKRKGNGPEEVVTATSTIINVKCEGLPYQTTVSAQNPQFTISETVNPEWVSYLNNVKLNGLTITFTIGGEEHTYSIPVIRDADEDSVKSTIAAYGEELFLSKTHDDTAAGVITFLRGLVAKGIITAEEGVQFGERFVPGYVGGQGGYIDKYGNGELESLMIRTFLEVPELRFNRISVNAGDQWQTNGGGIIERVEIDKDASGQELNTGTIWLKLEDGEAGTFVVNDKVKGIYHNLLGDNDTESTDDGRGNRTFKGFRTVYFVVTAVNSDEGKFNNRLSYELRPTTNGYWTLDEGGSSGVRGGFHPQQSMSIAQYSNAADKSRQNSVYRTTRYTRMLRNMVGWDEHVYNIGMQFGATELLAQAATHTEPAAYDGLRERMRQADRYFMWIDGDIMFSGTLNRVDSWGRDMPDYPDQGTHIAGKQYFYNDLVHKDGVVWRCVYAEKDSDGNYLPCTSTPSENGDWEKWIYTDSLKASGHWQPGTYPVNAIVMLGNTAYISNKITSDPPVGLLTDKNGVYLKDNEGYYFIVNEETTDDWNVLIDVGGITRGDDGESSVYITLTNDSDVLVTDSDGNVPAGTAYPSTMAQFYIGLSRILTGVVWTIDHTEGCSATIDAGGNVSTSNMTADRARVFINARYNDRDYQKIFGFRKSYGLTKYWLELSNDTVHFDPNTQAMSPRRILVHAYALTNGVKTAVTQASGLGRIVYNNNVIYDGDTITISREMFSDNHLILTLYDQPTTGGNVADAEDITFLEGGLNGQGIEDVGHWQSGRAYTHNEIAQLGNKRYIYYGDGSTTEPPVGLLLDKNGDYLVSRDGYYFPVTDECNDGWREFSADGVSITIERTEISYCATDSSERPSSGWSTQEPTVEEGQWLHVREIVVYSDGTITEKYSVSRAGIDGRGIQEANVFYAKSATELAMPEDDDKVTWYDLYSKMPSPVAGDWIWTKTVTTYSDGTKVTSYNCGLLGTDGNKYLSTEEFYALGVDNENAPAGWNHITEEGKYLPNDQWRTNRNFTEAEWKAKPYLWNIEISSYSDGTQSRTNPMCIGNFARGIDHFEELYAISASSIPGTGRQFPSDITNWDDEAQNAAPTDAKPYQWNKTVCYYNDSTTEEHYHVSAVKGTQGTAGQNAIRVDLDNENDTMLYSKGGQLLSGNVTSHAYLYDGATLVSSGVAFAIQSQTGCTASISGNTITVSAMSANTATVVVRATYKSKTYTTTLTLKKLVGVDRYEIVMSTTAANYNPNTKTVYPATVNVEVYKTDSQGTRAKLTTLPTGFALYLSNTSGSDGSAVTYASGKYSFSPVATNAEYIFTLKEGTVVHDRESMPVVMDGEDGKSITKKSEVKAYSVSSSATTTPTSWQTTKPTVAQNQYLWTRTTITWSDNSTTVLYQSERNPNDGENGMSIQIKSQAVTYCRRTAAQGPVSDPSTLTYGSYPSTLSKGDWLYSRTVVTYQTSGGSSAGSTTSYSVSYIGTDGTNGQDGTNGADGRGITAITEYYAASASKTSAPATSAFKTTLPTDWNASKPYLWNYEKTDYSKAPLSESSTPAIIATYTENGRGVDSIVNHYLATSAGSGVTKNTSGWTTTVQAITATKKYLWNYETTTWIEKDGTTTTTETDPHIIGVYGDKGEQGPQGPAGDSIDFAGHWLNGRSYQKGDIATIGNNAYIANAPTTEPPVGLLTDKNGNYITSKDGGYFPVTDEVNSSWNLMLSGGQAVTIVTDITEYVIASQGETPPSSGWSQYRPATEPGKYLWERHTITFSEGTVNISYNISYMAVDGEDGDSITITQMAISYAVSQDGTTIPEEGWSDQMPTTKEGDYLYTRTVVRYSDGNQTVTYTKGYIGVNGETYYITASAPAVHVNADGVPTPAADEQIQTVVKSTVTAWKHVAGKDDVQVPVVWEGVDQSPYGTSSQVFVQFATDQQRIVKAYEQVQQSGSATPQKGRLLAQFVITVTKDGANGKAGQGIVTSFVFKRAATKPTLPAATEGSFSSPVPTGWSDGIPPGTTPIWSTSRIFTSDEKSPQQSTWSPVRLMADTESYDVEFAKATADDKQPPAPTSANSIKGDTSANKIWYDPTEIDETTIKSEDMVWMAQRSRYVNESGNPVWSSWIISRIKGEQGDTGKDAIVYDIVTDLDSLEAYTSQLTVSIRKTVGGTSQTFYINPDTAYATDGLTLSFAGALASKAQLRMGSPSLVYLTNSPHANGSSLILRLTKGGVQVAEKEIRASYVTQYLMTVSPSQINVDAGGKFMSDTDKNVVVQVLKMLGNSDPVVVTRADGMEVFIHAKYNETQVYPDSTGKVKLTLDLRDTAKGDDGSRRPVDVELQTSEGNVISKMAIPIVASGDQGPQGLQGCSTRVSEFKPNTAYVNQDGINMEGGDLSVGYIDVVAVEMPKDDARYEASDGYFWYMCMVPTTADYGYLAPANGQDTWYHSGQSDQKLVWKALSAIGPSFFSLLIAKNAWIKFGSGNQFVIQDSEGNIVAGLTGYIPDPDNEDSSVRIWAGGEDPALSPFRVLQNGDFYAEKAHIKGLVEVRDANEGLIVYDSEGNARVQVVANEVDEPVNETISRTGTRRSSYQIAADESFNLTPTPISLNLGTLKTGAMLTVQGLSFTVSTNTGATHLKLTKRGGIAEKMTVSLVLMDSNGNVVTTLASTYTATSDTLIDDISFAFQSVLINTTATYLLGVSAKIEDINTANTDADTWGGLANNATVTSVASLSAKHATPVGTRIGTNGIFANLGQDKSVFINENSTEIKYGNNRLRVSGNGVDIFDGSDYVPIRKRTRTITSNYVVEKSDGVLVLNSSSRITLTLRSTSSPEFNVICQNCPGYDINGMTVYKFNNSTPTSPWQSDDKRPRMFVSDGASTWYEFYCGN